MKTYSIFYVTTGPSVADPQDFCHIGIPHDGRQVTYVHVNKWWARIGLWILRKYVNQLIKENQ